MTAVHLNVYVAIGTAAASRTVHLVDRMVQELGIEATINVIDVLESPEAAEQADVIATPTIDCVLPLPLRRVVGIPTTTRDLVHGLVLDGHVA